MLFNKTGIIGLALAGIMTIGGTTAFAAGNAPLKAESTALVAAGNVSVADIVANTGTVTVVKGVTLHPADGKTAKTETGQTLTVAAGKVNFANVVVKKGTLTIVKGATPSMAGGQAITTAAAE